MKMTDTERSSGIFTSGLSLSVGDIEAGSSSGKFTDTERKVSLIEAPLGKRSDGGSNHENVQDIEKWVGSLQRLLEDVPHYMCKPAHPGRISRIPQNIREVNVEAYEPYMLSIGPYHHAKQRVQRMEKRKQVVLKDFLEKRPELTMKDCLQEITNIEPETRSFYSDIHMESEEFVPMLLLDGLYIVTSLCGGPKGREIDTQIGRVPGCRLDSEDINEISNQFSEGIWSKVDDESNKGIATTNEQQDETRIGLSNSVRPRWFWTLFIHDIFLLENQLPFFVLQKIYNLVHGGPEEKLMGRLKEIVSDMLADYIKLDSETVISAAEEIHHLLHLCHMFFRPVLRQESTTWQIPNYSQIFRLGSVSQLYETGVSFKARSGSNSYSLLDITFTNSGLMVMPCLCVDDNTDSLLRNLIALEQMKYPCMGLDVSAYAVLLLHLITTPEDVMLLRKKGIIQHHLSSDKEMMYLINQLSVGLAFDYVEDSYSLKPVFQQLKRYTEHRVPRWKALFKHKYFTNPWTAISLFAATFLLLLTALQTWYSVYSYYNPFLYGNSRSF